MSTPGFFHDLLAQERANFVNVGKAVLDDGLGYRPDPKARTSGEQLGHLIGHFLDIAELAEDGVIHHRNQVPFDSVDDAARQLDDSIATALAKVAAADADQWLAPAKFFVGEQMIMEAPRQVCAWMLFLDAIQHRGQLMTHLRPMGSRVPSVYGPSADAETEGH